MIGIITLFIALTNASTYYSVLETNGVYRVSPGRFSDACAIGFYDIEQNTTGWN